MWDFDLVGVWLRHTGIRSGGCVLYVTCDTISRYVMTWQVLLDMAIPLEMGGSEFNKLMYSTRA